MEFALLLRALQLRLGGLDARGLRRSAGHTVVATVAMAEVVLLLLILLRAAGVEQDSVPGALLLSAAGALAGAVTYTLAALLLRSEEYASIVGRLRRG